MAFLKYFQAASPVNVVHSRRWVRDPRVTGVIRMSG
jgi:hypothetical protein